MFPKTKGGGVRSGERRLMPKRARKACTQPGCPGTVADDICSVCGPRKRRRDRAYDDQRQSSTQRGYDARWRRLRLAFLRAHPLCVQCAAQGIITAAQEVDHVTPLRDGGTNEWANLQPLCKSCHSHKTMTEGRGIKSLGGSNIDSNT